LPAPLVTISRRSRQNSRLSGQPCPRAAFTRLRLPD
jgi:hypothetical protein